MRRMRDDGVTHVVMEVSSHGLATHRVNPTRFDVGVFTNLSRDHLDFHGSMEEYRAAKQRLFTELLPLAKARGKSPVAVVNVDDGEGRRLAGILRDAGLPMVAYGRGDEPEVRAAHVTAAIDGTTIEIEARENQAAGIQDEVFRVRTRLIGGFNVSNVLAAVASALASGVSSDAIRRGLDELRGVPGRLERVSGPGQPSVFVDYAHTPDALERALKTLRPLAEERLCVVFGCGGDRDRSKRPMMGEVASRMADLVVLTSDNPRSEDPEAIVAAVEKGVDPAKAEIIREVDRARAIKLAIRQAGPSDVVLIAGKGHEDYQEIGGQRRSFDDALVAREYLVDASD